MKKDEDGNEIDCTCIKRGDACDTDVCACLCVYTNVCERERERHERKNGGGDGSVYMLNGGLVMTVCGDSCADVCVCMYVCMYEYVCVYVCMYMCVCSQMTCLRFMASRRVQCSRKHASSTNNSLTRGAASR